MSELLSDNSDFLGLLLKTSPKQQKALLDSITASQAQLIGEIFLNILDIEHDDADYKFLKNKVLVLEKLANNSLSARFRRGYIKKHKSIILKIINYFKDNLQKVL